MEQEQVIRSLRRQLLIERAIIGVVLLVLLIRWVFGYFGNAPYAILVDGRPVVFLATSESARNVLAAVKRSKAGTEENVEFVQEVRIARSRDGGPVVAESKGIELVSKKIRVRMEKWVIMSNGKPVVAVDAKETAATVLEQLKAEFGQQVKNLLEEPQFKENVKVELTQVDEALYRRSVEDAIEQILHPASIGRGEISEYEIKKGDIAGNIASRFSISLRRLQDLNPERNLDRLQIGDKLRVYGEATSEEPKITVIVRDLVTDTEPIPYTTHTISSTGMYRGKEFVSQLGRNGLRRIQVAVTYENGVRKGSEILDEEIIREPVSKQVVAGTKPR